MMNVSEIRNLPFLSTDARQALIGAFSALAHWRDEVFSVNERCLTKALDEMGSAQRALGWPDHVVVSAREHLLKVSKIQTHMIDQVMDAWEQRLKSLDAPAAIAEAFKLQMPSIGGGPFTDPLAGMAHLAELTLAPFRLWMQAAEVWQRSWTVAVSGVAKPRELPPTK